MLSIILFLLLFLLISAALSITSGNVEKRLLECAYRGTEAASSSRQVSESGYLSLLLSALSTGLPLSRALIEIGRAMNVGRQQTLSVSLSQESFTPRTMSVSTRGQPGAMVPALAFVGEKLDQGIPWDSAWGSITASTNRARDSDVDTASDAGSHRGLSLAALLEQCLRPAWEKGLPIVPLVESLILRLQEEKKSRIEQAGSLLMVKILIPTGLCFLPALLLIAVVPTIASFAL